MSPAGHVGVGSDVPHQLGHEALTEPHHLVVGTAVRMEVGASLAAAHRQRGQRVLEHLLEREEFQHAKRHGMVEAKAALVRTERAVHLHAEPRLMWTLAAVVLPGHPEHDHALGLDDPLEDLCFGEIGPPLHDEVKALEDFFDRLVELRFCGVLGFDQTRECR